MLLALGVCAFLPVLGVFFGAGAVTWGLLSNRPGAKLGVILGGTGALLNVLGAVVLMARYQRAPIMEQARVEMARQNLVQLVSELERYRGRTGRYPATLQELVGQPIPIRLINIYDQTAGIFTVPRFYQYRLGPDGSSYDLFATGPDGQPGTPDDVRPVVPDSMLDRTGYRRAN